MGRDEMAGRRVRGFGAAAGGDGGHRAGATLIVRMHLRRAVTLLELLVVIAIAAVLGALALPRLRGVADRGAARGAATELSALFGEARDRALAGRRSVAVLVDTATGGIALSAGGTTLVRRSLGAGYGVRLSATRDSMAYDGRGLGFGAANLTVVARRGGAAETVSVSRLGRVRR